MSGQAVNVVEPYTNPTDTAILALLADGPLPAAEIAGRLGLPERTVRHRLLRLRQAGLVITHGDGFHRLAAAVPPTLAVAGDDGAGVQSADHPGRRTAVAVLAACGCGLAVAGGLAAALVGRRLRSASPLPATAAPPAPPWGGEWEPGVPW